MQIRDFWGCRFHHSSSFYTDRCWKVFIFQIQQVAFTNKDLMRFFTLTQIQIPIPNGSEGSESRWKQGREFFRRVCVGQKEEEREPEPDYIAVKQDLAIELRDLRQQVSSEGGGL
jgi:hypothetical protein